MFRMLRKSFLLRRYIQRRFCNTWEHDNVYMLCKHLDVNEEKARYIQLKQPYIRKLCEEDVEGMIEAIHNVGYPKEVLIDYPNLFHMLPVTLKNRFRILEECGFQNITPDLLLSYLTITKQKSIAELRREKLISSLINIENRLASYMTQWPTSLTTLILGDSNLMTLYQLRLRIIQRYLELMLDLSKDEFYRGLKTYPTIQHRPLRAINEVLLILQSQVGIPNQKIKSNLYLIHADPDNLRKILFKLRFLGGMDIKEVIRMYPKLATKNYSTLIETKQVLDKHGISPEAQSRCLQIYTLSPKTIEERLEHAKSTPEFRLYLNHPRFLKMIHYNKTVLKRMQTSKINNKKCMSLNVLSGSSVRYEAFERTPGDRLGKGKDLVFAISQALGEKFSKQKIRNFLRRHPFWINIPLVEIKYVCDKLSSQFSPQDIYENCAILLYPWNKIKKAIDSIDKMKNIGEAQFLKDIDFTKLSNSQKLSLALYMVEKDHYFSGNGVWTEEHQKNIVNLSEPKQTKQISVQL